MLRRGPSASPCSTSPGAASSSWARPGRRPAGPDPAARDRGSGQTGLGIARRPGRQGLRRHRRGHGLPGPGAGQGERLGHGPWTLSPEALDLARANAAALGLAASITFAQGDLCAPLAGGAPLDLVLSNPPYVAEADRDSLAPEVGRWEPGLALFSGPQGLDAPRRLLARGPRPARSARLAGHGAGPGPGRPARGRGRGRRRLGRYPHSRKGQLRRGPFSWCAAALRRRHGGSVCTSRNCCR